MFIPHTDPVFQGPCFHDPSHTPSGSGLGVCNKAIILRRTWKIIINTVSWYMLFFQVLFLWNFSRLWKYCISNSHYRIEPRSPAFLALQGGFLPLMPGGKPIIHTHTHTYTHTIVCNVLAKKFGKPKWTFGQLNIIYFSKQVCLKERCWHKVSFSLIF